MNNSENEVRTERMIMKTNLIVKDGRLCVNVPEKAKSIFEIVPNNIEDGCFAFYDKSSSDIVVCTIAYTDKRNKPELYYETTESYRNNGYMSEALPKAIHWIKHNTEEQQIWLLIDDDNLYSKKLAVKNNFTKVEGYENNHYWWMLSLT